MHKDYYILTISYLDVRFSRYKMSSRIMHFINRRDEPLDKDFFTH